LRASLHISSPSNPTIKELVRLKERKGERADHFFIVEGRREIERAIKSGFKMTELYICPELSEAASADWIFETSAIKSIEVSKQVFAKIATREGSDGLIGVFASRPWRLEDITDRASGDHFFLLVLENVEKPGNLGAMFRTADAFGVHGVILLGQSIDLWNANVIRSSLGGVFSVPVLYLKNEDFLEFSSKQNIKLVAAALKNDSVSLNESELSGPMAMIFGSEAFGLSDALLGRVHTKVVIPMQGVCDSLNVSVAAGIFAFEVSRQRLQGRKNKQNP
jgi:TrmH family RNA methyltransferase